VTPSDVSVESYLRVFQMIFEEVGQAGHYFMMMHDASVGPHEGKVVATVTG
jgi:hypothetical protein